MIALWYRAWADARPTVQMDRPGEDRFGARLDALTGVDQPALARAAMRCRGRTPALRCRFVAQARNAEGLRAVLIGLFDVAVQVQEFVATVAVTRRRTAADGTCCCAHGA